MAALRLAFVELDMQKLFITAAFAVALTVPTVAQEMTGVEHNGSLMLLTRDEDGHTEIKYDTPHAGLPVAKGALLFTGTYDFKRNVFTGTAYVFKRGCEPAPYPVFGSQTGPGIVLIGDAPVRDLHSCAILGSVGVTRATLNNKNVRLVFAFESEGE